MLTLFHREVLGEELPFVALALSSRKNLCANPEVRKIYLYLVQETILRRNRSILSKVTQMSCPFKGGLNNPTKNSPITQGAKGARRQDRGRPMPRADRAPRARALRQRSHRRLRQRLQPLRRVRPKRQRGTRFRLLSNNPKLTLLLPQRSFWIYSHNHF